MADLPTPDPVAIMSLSPTAANDLLACPYRLAWRLDARYKTLRRPTPWSSLGVVAHAVAQNVSKGLLAGACSVEDARSRLEKAWDSHLAKANSYLVDRWKPASPPPPTEWPGYHLTRAKTIRRALRQWSAPQPPSRGSATTYLIEKPLHDPALGLSGRPDRVEGTPGNLCVVDLKTGLAQAGPTVSQRRQLLVYCHLVGVATGDLPTRVAVEDPSGRRWESTVTPDEVAGIVDEIQVARTKYEAAMESRLTADTANPNAATCRHCAFRVVCGPYWTALEAEWGHGSVRGHVLNVHKGERGSIMFVDAVAPQDAAGPDWVVMALPGDFTAKPGTVIALTNAEPTGAPRQLRWRWSTVSWPTSIAFGHTHYV